MPTRAVDPLNWQTKIINPNGTPTAEFLRQWQAQRGNNGNTSSEIAALRAVKIGGDGAGITPEPMPLSSGNITLSLKPTGVSPGAYGDASHVARITLGPDGRVSAVEEVGIAGSSAEDILVNYVVKFAPGVLLSDGAGNWLNFGAPS